MFEKERAFIAVHFSDDVIANLTTILSQARRMIGEQSTVRWVEPRNVHLTLQFLGDIDTSVVPILAGELRGAFSDIQPFEVTLTGLGAFPAPARPRVIWIGIHSGVDNLKTLQAGVEVVTTPLGFIPDKRSFKPHVTLGRVKENRRSMDLTNTLAKLHEAQAGTSRIDTVFLTKSDLKPTGPVYSILDSFPLGR
jgi:RNA 2',3'-cyclic 3'-phosphodiesterase